ncbi:MAG: glycosyltransferase, partial [Halioglobus sp.]
MQPKPAEVCILMATYNGAPYVEAQVASIQAQTLGEWRLLVRDDGSSDGTQGILERLARHDERITLVEDTAGSSGGAAQNFARLMT